MRTLAIGDIHGCSRALQHLLRLVKPQPHDQIIALGDYVDRGPDSFGVIENLLDLKRRCSLVTLLGNHEQMMLAAREDPTHLSDWLSCGGRETLASYSILGDSGKLVDVPDHHWQFLEAECVHWYQTGSHFFVHANVNPDLELAEQPLYVLLWEFFACPSPHCSGKTMICGHTPQKTGMPRNLGHAVCIDTCAWEGGWLTCLDVVSGRYWQARQSGETRTASIEDCIPQY